MKITLLIVCVLGSLMANAQNTEPALAELAAENAPVIESTNALEIAAIATPAANTEAPAARPEFELSCRAEAKEIAANTYRSCMSDNRNAQVEQLKKAHQSELAALKEKYEAEIKALNVANAAALEAKVAEAARAEKNAASVAGKSATANKVAPAKARAAKKSLAPKAKKTTTAAASRAAPTAKVKKATPISANKAAKKQAQKISNTNSAETAKPAVAAMEFPEVKEMTIELKPTARSADFSADESTMDIPEPIPLEN